MKDEYTQKKVVNNPSTTRNQLYWNTLVRIPAHALRVVSSVVVARKLVPEDYGIVGIGMMLIGYANLFTTFGFGEALIQRGITDRRVIRSVFTIDLTVSLILASIFYAASGVIADFFDTPQAKTVIQILSLFFILTAFQSTPHAILRRKMDFKAISIIDITKGFLVAVLTLILAYMGLGYWALVFGQLVPFIFVNIMLSIRAGWFPVPYFNHQLMKSIYDFGIWNFLKSQLEFISKNVDKFVIGRWMGTVALGFYDKAMSFAVMPLNHLTMNINAVLFSSFSANKENRKELQTQLKKSFTLIAGINFPIYVGLAVTAPHLVNSLLGEKWAPMVACFQIILAACMVKSFSGMVAAFNVGTGKYRQHTIRSFFSIIGFVAACLYAMKFGIEGIALAFLFYCVLFMSLTGSLVCGQLSVTWREFVSPVSPPLIGSLIMGGMVYLFGRYVMPEYTIVNLIVLCLLGVCVYGAFILVDSSWQTRELKKTIRKDISKLPLAGKLAGKLVKGYS
ncbi:MAG: lipopolysaccharide biosynthesis protein [Chitinivibrionales bacterium]